VGIAKYLPLAYAGKGAVLCLNGERREKLAPYAKFWYPYRISKKALEVSQ
jgi:hypothetical protein